MDKQDYWVNRVRLALEGAEDLTGANAPDIAKQLGFSEKTLRRRLSVNGENFSALLDRERRRRCYHAAINNPQIQGAELCPIIGYQEPNSATRRFNEWFGVNLTQFRDNPEVLKEC